MAEQVTIRRMNRDDVDLAIDWAAEEGWNPGLHDAECFYAADPRGFFLAEMGGEAVGCISAVAYDGHFGFSGFYIVRSDLRRQGIGMELTATALQHMGNRTVGGDGVVAMLDKYERIGFRIAHRNARYEGEGSFGRDTENSVVRLEDIPFAELEEYDRRYFPAPRSGFLRTWISRPGTHGCAAVTEDRLEGYGVMRPCRRGFKIGPLFADTPEKAEALFTALTSHAQGEPVFLDIPVSNEAACELVERHAMRKVFETARVYKGPAPQLPLEGIYGITSFELG